MKLTDEQLLIRDSKAQSIKIMAGAGTGKTTTLVAYTKANPRSSFLYLAFNKAIKDEASKKFGVNVRSMTGHGLAYSRVGRAYGEIPDKLAISDLKPTLIIPYLERKSLLQIPSTVHNLYAGRVMETINRFLVSADMEMELKHVSLGRSPTEVKYFNEHFILNDAKKLWIQMIDLKSPAPISHDGYLKLFHLEDHRLNVDSILLDEAQDTNPVLRAIVESQSAQMIYVGDEHQSIYSFRGAENAMAHLDADEEFMLTGSFRFGPEIAEIANHLLAAKGEENLRIRGLGAPSTVGAIEENAPHAFITRGNSALFARAVEALEKNQTFAFVGPLGNYRLDLMFQTQALASLEKSKVTDPFLKAFNNFDELAEYADAMEDKEIQGRCKLVTRFGGRIPYLVSQIRARAGTYPSKQKFDVVLSSGHRSKGLEFDNVILGDDFKDFFVEETGKMQDLSLLTGQDMEEVNLQYVAVTRAQKRLQLGAKLESFIHFCKNPPTAGEKGFEKDQILQNEKKKL